MKHVLLLGATGTAGSALTQKLLRESKRDFVFDGRNRRPPPSHLKFPRSRVVFGRNILYNTPEAG